MALRYAISSTDGAVSFDDTNIVDLIKLTEQCNSGTNLQLGSCVAAELNFKVKDLSMTLPQISGKEFSYDCIEISPYTFRDGDELMFRDGDNYYFIDNTASMGLFTPSKVERINDTQWNITMLDRMAKFDVDATSWAASLAADRTIGQIFQSLCSFVGVTPLTAVFPNSTFVVRQNFTAENLTARDVLQWIGEASARFFIIDKQGRIEPRWYADTDVVIDNTNTFDLKVADYTTDPITKVSVVSTETDIGVIVGTGTNSYNIKENPLLYATSDAQLRPAVTNIYNVLNGFQYAPVTATIINEDTQILPGDSFKVTSFRESNLPTIAMKVERTPGKLVLTSTGDKTLSTKAAVNRVIKRLEGRTNEIVATIDEFSVTLSDTEADVAQLKITATAITTEVNNKVDKTTYNSYVSQTATEISSKVSSTDYNGNTIATKINQSATTVAISASKINLTGALDLNGSFTTVSGAYKSIQTQGRTDYYYNNTLVGFFCAYANEMMWETRNGKNIYLASDANLNISGVSTNIMSSAMSITSSYCDFNLQGNTYRMRMWRPDGTVHVSLTPVTAATCNIGTGTYYFDYVQAVHLVNKSSRKIKKNIKPMTDAAYDFDKIQPVTYELKDGHEGEVQIGFIAEDMDEACKYVTVYENDEPSGIMYDKITAILTNEIRKLQKRVQELEAQNGDKAS